MLIEALEIDDQILEKIESKHGVTFEEAEDACLSDGRHVRRGKEGLYKVFNQVYGRYLLIVLADKGNGIWRIVTAREMSPSERKLYSKIMGR